MSRYNFFYWINKGLRTLLYDTGFLLQRTDFTVAEEAMAAHDRLQVVLSSFEALRFKEAQYILPAITYYEPGIADRFNQERTEVYRLHKALEELLKNDDVSHSHPKQTANGLGVVAAFEELSLLMILQMNSAEKLLPKILWRYYSDSELQTIAWKMAANNDAICFYKWIIRGLSAGEVIRWLNEVQAIANEAELKAMHMAITSELQFSAQGLWQQVPEEGIMA